MVYRDRPIDQSNYNIRIAARAVHEGRECDQMQRAHGLFPADGPVATRLVHTRLKLRASRRESQDKSRMFQKEAIGKDALPIFRSAGQAADRDLQLDSQAETGQASESACAATVDLARVRIADGASCISQNEGGSHFAKC
jgi:hypothetical protein